MKIGASLTEWLPLLGSLALKSLILFALAGAALLALRRASASARHLVCLLTLAALLALPGLSLLLPGWHLPVPLMSVAQGPTPRQIASPSEAGGEGVLAQTAKRTPTVSAQTPIAPRIAPSSSSRLGRTPVSAANKEVGWTTLLTALWLLGFAAALLRPLLGLWGIAGLSRLSASITKFDTLALTTECASALHLTAAPALRQADSPVPMTWGWRRPVILLPLEAHTWPEDRLRAVLLHELAHVRRRDWLSHRFADFVCALYWFHPFVWLAARRLRAESEIACDDLVLTSGIAAPDYARHLLDVARALRPASSAVPQAAIAMARTTQIEGRLKMILDTTRSRRALTRRVLLIALIPGTAVVTGLAMLRPAAKAASNVVAPIANSVKSQASAVRSFINPVSPHPHISPKKAAPVSAVSLLALARLLAVTPKAAALPPKPVQIASSDIAPEAVLPAAADPVRKTSTDVTNAPVALPAAPTAESDVSVELAGVTDSDKPGSVWWSANGDPLPSPVFNIVGRHAAGQRDTKNLFLAFRFPAAAHDLTVCYQVPQSTRTSSEGVWPTKLYGEDRKTEAQSNTHTNGTRVLEAAFPRSLSQTHLRVGIASAPWKTIAADTLTGVDGYGDTVIQQGNSKFIFGPALETKADVVLTISTDATDDLRVVAVDIQGQESLPVQIGDMSNGALDQITAHFNLPLAQIREFRVEARPFRWMEIKDIALQPAK